MTIEISVDFLLEYDIINYAQIKPQIFYYMVYKARIFLTIMKQIMS